jgi:signal transduction histidine kinase
MGFYGGRGNAPQTRAVTSLLPGRLQAAGPGIADNAPVTTAVLTRLAVRALPRRSVRLRLTVLYGALFLISGGAVLTITYLLVRHSSGHFVIVKLGTADAPALPRLPDPALQAHEQRDRMLHQLLTQSAIALGIMSVVSVALGWVMAGRALRPLEEAFAAQRRFVANASHELRTPLAMMRTSVDVATGKPGPLPPEVAVLGDKVREGLDQADGLLESFLVLARAQNGAVDARERVAVAALVDAAVAEREPEIRARGVRIEREGARSATLTGDPTLLARLVGNLMDNAVRHNVPGGWVRVTAAEGPETTELVVENGGPRLSDDDLAALAEPFRRLGGDRVRSADGHGLGLSIVRAIAEAHGGTLRLEARPAGGLRATVRVPVRAAAHAHGFALV